MEENRVKPDGNSQFNEPLAIIGMNCQFPGVDADIEDVTAFYEMLISGQTPIKNVPKNRWNIDDYYDADRNKSDKIITTKGGFLDNPYLFDAEFFKISPAEAKHIDPQHRLFLEVSIRALNHANLRLDSLNGSNTGVYCGISMHDYGCLNYKDDVSFNEHTLIGVAPSAAVGRLCHFLNLKGPSMAVDTACSSSLSALYLAATALRARQCNLAIVGGVNLQFCPENWVSSTKANMLSAIGRCSSFDITADGFVRSEGCGVIIVKRLSDAIKDNNTIHAVIKSVVMNQDGAGTALVSPNMDAQIALHQAALAEAQLLASDIDYIETHGTGTVLGDRVEFNGIRHIHEGQHDSETPLYLGALKSNLGHTLSSSGIASLIKAICALKYERIPPNLHFSTPNNAIEPEHIPVVFPVEAIPFVNRQKKKRIAQVTNYGFTGINVSTIIEEAPVFKRYGFMEEHTKSNCFVVSANSEASLKKMLATYAQFLRQSSARLCDICYTLINCRDHYKFRCAILANDKESLVHALESANYDIEKVIIQKEVVDVEDDAQQIAKLYLTGSNIRITINPAYYQQIDLPLYYFDRKPYWHEPRLRPDVVHRQPVIQVVNVEPIAIIGMSCRFPKAGNLNEFLSLLERGESGMTDIPIERWDNTQYYDADLDAPGKLCIKQLGLIDHVKAFDADFFNISPREAKFMSPQIRVFLETSYHALEHANYSLDSVRGSSTGVFVGVGTNDYSRALINHGVSLEDLNIYFATGNVLNAVAGRVAYAFDFHGPIQAIDTACSSSMTAIHNACLSLQSGDCSMALAGGINIVVTPDSNVTLSKARMLSPDSRCKTFSEDADGYARSEGCGVLVLKRLSKALEDKDNILAVIKGSSINSDGKSGGFTVPNATAQEEVIRSALAKAQLTPADIDYIEAHGTGTKLADPIEANTLTKIFSEYHSQDNPLFIGSVKTNIGHCENASGVAGVIKSVLSLQTETLFKHLNFKCLNPAIQLHNTIIPLRNLQWPKRERLRSAGVSSFGFSGANAHLILQEAPGRKTQARILPQTSLLVLSAKSKRSLLLLLSRYQRYLLQTEDEFADICYTAATCRSHYLFRVALVASTAKQAATLIEQQNYTIYQITQEQEVQQHPRDLQQLQSAYQDGFKLRWSEFYQSLMIPFEKVNLPLYEFDRELYWFADQHSFGDAPYLQNWCFQLQWESQACNAPMGKLQGNHWLLVGDKVLASGLEKQGLHIVLEEDHYAFDQLDGIVFATEIVQTQTMDIDAGVEVQKQTIKQLLKLVKTLHQQALKLRLIVLTSQAIAELSEGPLNLNHSALIGFCKTLALELPQFHTTLIDFERPYVTADAERVANEIRHNHDLHYEHMIAYRADKRLVLRLKRRGLGDIKRTDLSEGRYLITGGCGGLGLESAKSLLSAGARDIVLIARHVDKPATLKAIQEIQTHYPLQNIRAISLDVTDKEKLGQLVLDLNEGGLLKGVIHAAGVAIKAPLLEHHDNDVDDLFSAKVKGAWYLHELTQGINLDFFIVYSSISSVFGSNKESVYSGTNSFLDALIAERRRLGLVGMAIQWGPWGEVGMATRRAGDQNLKSALVSNAQGNIFVTSCIHASSSHTAIISPDYLKFMLEFVSKPLPGFYRSLAMDLMPAEQSMKRSSWLSDYQKSNPEQRAKACKDLVRTICANILEHPNSADLDEDDGFFNMGFDSLMITELAAELKKRLAPSLNVTINIGLDYPSINQLSAYIEAELGEVT